LRWPQDGMQRTHSRQHQLVITRQHQRDAETIKAYVYEALAEALERTRDIDH
jgi:hypothetical protein